MNSYTHMVVGGLSAGILVAVSAAQTTLGWEVNSHSIYPLLTVIPSIYGAIGPDIDMPNAKGGRMIRKFLKLALFITMPLVLVLSIVTFITGGSFLDLFIPVFIFAFSFMFLSFLKTVKHRGITHTGISVILLTLPFYLYIKFGSFSLLTNIFLSIYLGFLIGWLSHLIADSFNKKGIPWLYPFTKKKFHIATVLTGHHEETIFRTIVCVIFIIIYVLIIMFGR